MKIVLISSDEALVRQMEALCAHRQSGYRLCVVHASIHQIAQYRDQIQQSDLLMVNLQNLSDADLDAIGTIRSIVPPAGCVLLAAPLTTRQYKLAMRAGVRHVLETPLDDAAVRVELAFIADQLNAEGARQGRIVSLLACNGGSGTSLIAANLAAIHAKQGNQRVLVIDLCQQFAAAHLYLSEALPATSVADLCTQVDRLDPALFEASVLPIYPNLDLLAGAGDPVRAAEMAPESMEHILALACQLYDTVIIDIGQSMNALSICALDQSEHLCTVLQASVQQLSAAQRLGEMLSGLGYPRERNLLLINQYDRKTATLGLEVFKDKLGIMPTCVLPPDRLHVEQSVIQGKPLIQIAHKSPLVLELSALALTLWPQPDLPSNLPPKKNRLFQFSFRHA